ncbi:GntR family transcriptional regulator [Reticulibacter mediterranei]|uniref:GntR family transcriptional regulator n=1 Tax=Reticulibacter mediterranei TaxID=2778369 RepID=A0A8J3N2U2_9CHLR|nr:GntR family transcriptional regulator [Reticulibacter mediterranei]GHO93535.1 GntR family transcriptional regulator [Reticulibacter mediterranei]
MDKMEHYTLHQRIYYKLRELIESGKLPGGMQLDERTLAQELSVSRTPLREAIASLVEEGLVERRPYRGNFVRTFTAKQVNDLYRVRQTLEGLAIRLAVSNITEDDLERIRAILAEAQEALEHDDMAAYSLADQRFHETIALLSGNEILIESLNRLKRQIQIVRIGANRDPQVVRRTALERPRILSALEARDADLATRLLEEHIDGVRRSVVALIENTTIATE